MKPRHRHVATLAALAMALSPSAALAQSAGDDQYEDPFAEEQSEQATPTPTPAPVTDDPGFADDGGGEPDSAPAETTQDTGDDATGEEAATPAEAEDQLPRTGAEAALVGLMGTGLLLTGVGLRLRLRDGAPSA